MRRKSLAEEYPELVTQWGTINEISPSDVSSGSHKKVWWVCENGHEWKARVADRAEGHGCPYCAGHRVWKGYNDLATTHSKLIPEWSDRNELSPDSITYKNRSNVWWYCNKCGNEYQAVVYARANGRVCPFCIAIEIGRLREDRLTRKRIAKDFVYLLPQLATIYYAGRRGLAVRTDTEAFIGIPVTAFLPDIKLIIDVCSAAKEKKLKGYICSINKIKYISIEERLPEEESIAQVRAAFSAAHVYIDSPSAKDLEYIRNWFIRWKQQ